MLLVFIINPHAGNGRSHVLVDRLCAKGEANGLLRVSPTEKRKAKGCILHLQAHSTDSVALTEIRVYRNFREADSLGLCRELSAKHGKNLVVVACGGDGTANEVAQGLEGSASGMMVIPFGSGNDFVKSIYKEEYRHSARLLEALGLDEKHYKEAEDGAWPDLTAFPVDLVQFVDDQEKRRSFVNVMSIGFDSGVAITASGLVRRFPGIGKVAYMLSIVPALFKKKIFRLEYGLYGSKWEKGTISESAQVKNSAARISAQQDYSLAALANSRYYGGGFQPNPFMNLQDGVIEVLISKPINLVKIAQLIGAYRKGEAQKSDILTMFSAKRGYIKSTKPDEPLVITYDGEALYSSRIDFEVKEKALWLSMPKACANERLQAENKS